MSTGAEHRDIAAALLDPAAACPPGLLTWNGSDAAQRFGVHRNNVAVSLIDALADTFPVVQQLVGEAFFRAMAGEFVRRSPPASPVLAWYGDAFAKFVAAFPPATGVPYLADVARLEYARVLAECALVLRHVLSIEVIAIPALAGSFVAALQAGKSLGEARSQVASADATFDAAPILGILIGRAQLVGVDHPLEPPGKPS